MTYDEMMALTEEQLEAQVNTHPQAYRQLVDVVIITTFSIAFILEKNYIYTDTNFIQYKCSNA